MACFVRLLKVVDFWGAKNDEFESTPGVRDRRSGHWCDAPCLGDTRTRYPRSTAVYKICWGLVAHIGWMSWCNQTTMYRRRDVLRLLRQPNELTDNGTWRRVVGTGNEPNPNIEWDKKRMEIDVWNEMWMIGDELVCNDYFFIITLTTNACKF